MIFALLLLGYAAASTTGLLLLRTALPDAGSATEALTDPRVVGGGVLYVASFAVWMLALRRYELTLAYPVFIGTGYAAVVGASVFVLGERLSALQVGGIALIAAGIVLIVR